MYCKGRYSFKSAIPGKWSNIIVVCCLLLQVNIIKAQQVLRLKEALETASGNYGIIKAKEAYGKASAELVSQSKNEYLPNLVFSVQQDYGTINGQNGPLYGFGGYGVASSGLPLPNQNWNAAFGALYLANVNWEFFAFGRAVERVKTAQAVAARDASDHAQELFQHQVKVAAAYLNLVAAQKLTLSQHDNLARADTLRFVIATRAKNGLIAGVDSSLANAEVSNARVEWIRAKDNEQERANQLAVLMGVKPLDFVLDTGFVRDIPALFAPADTTVEHPLLRFYQNRIAVSDQQAKYFNTFRYPAFSLFGVLQTRGSGFSSNYAVDRTAFNHRYWDGIKPNRTNYLLGVGVTWNFTSVLRINHQVQAQQLVSKALHHEYETIDQQIKFQQELAESKIKNALSTYAEVPVQLKAASDAFLQKSVLYKNGLVTIVEVTQALNVLNRAETSRDIIYTNVWQSLLIKAAAAGDLSLFLNELK